MFQRNGMTSKEKREERNLGAIYAKKTLQPDEKIIYISRFHWIFTLKAIGPLLASIALIVVAWLLGVIGPFLLVLSLPAFFALAHAIGQLAYRYVNRVLITNKRLIIQQGWTSRKTTDLGLDRILGHKIVEDAWGRALGYGSFVIFGAGVGEIGLPPYMANPTRFRTALTGAKEGIVPGKEEKPAEKRGATRGLIRAFSRR